jgi:hypothetical protein
MGHRARGMRHAGAAAACVHGRRGRVVKTRPGKPHAPNQAWHARRRGGPRGFRGGMRGGEASGAAGRLGGMPGGGAAGGGAACRAAGRTTRLVWEIKLDDGGM